MGYPHLRGRVSLQEITMKEALFYKKLNNNITQCKLCPHYCTIKEGMVGICGVRKNISGKLYATTYGKPCSIAIDPIEKKPLYHFLPGSRAYSIAAAGCNLKCGNCQNYEISQARVENMPYHSMTPEQVVEDAIGKGCRVISYTYTEPTIFAEYVIDIAKLARKKGIKNVMVSNGFINPEPLKAVYKNIDAANIDLKGFTEEFYKKNCGARLMPVLETLKSLHKMKVWFEITNLVINKLNDDMKKISEMCTWIKENLGPDHPLFFSRFFPMYKLTNIMPTPIETVKKAYEVAKKAGLNYVYTGNLGKENNTYCPQCKVLVVKRHGFSAEEAKIKNGKCVNGHRIPGVW